MRIGIFGGTFDPPHVGHLILAQECAAQLKLDRLLWVLTPVPPHKRDRGVTPLRDRLALVRAAISQDGTFELSRVEIDRPGPHYAVDTLALLRQEHPQAELIYLMGGDSLRNLPDWNEPLTFMWTCNEIGVMRRPGDQIDMHALESLLPGISNRVYFIEAPLLEISSTEIRERIAAGQPYRYYLPPSVYRLIEKRGLYR
jgi:nicotinate-nucleotide adenylyltransferase